MPKKTYQEEEETGSKPTNYRVPAHTFFPLKAIEVLSNSYKILTVGSTILIKKNCAMKPYK
ncbi:MAG: hypothetical protein IJH34_08455 [Romboutsia sp.]|nr:hypothetical protein [Romboutsia sp.]